MPERQRLGRSFGRIAGSYARARSGYPDEAIAWVSDRLELAAADVLDLGAGTGKLTRQLLPFAGRVVAVEPLEEMRREFRRELPDVPLLEGEAEQFPLPDETVHAVTVGQAFHWFDAAAALAEIARVLRPRGGLALLWNAHLDDEVGTLLGELLERLRPPGESPDWRDAFAASPLFDPLEERHFEWSERLARDAFIERIATTSVVAKPR